MADLPAEEGEYISMNTDRKIIAVTGLMGSGKSTVARILRDGHGFDLLKFAYPLKAMLKALYDTCGLDAVTIERKIEGDLKGVPCEYLQGKTPRFAMQTLGTEWGRGLIDQDLWVNMMKYRILSHRGNVVIDDCRFANEARFVKYLGGTVWRVERHQNIAVHISELGQADIQHDIGLGNFGDLRDLQQAVETALSLTSPQL